MICAIKTCRSEIDDDSKFCDQCGAEIFICPRCNAPGAGKFCTKDGTNLVSRKKQGAAQQKNAQSAKQNMTVQGLPETGEFKTVLAQFNNTVSVDELVMVHSSGMTLKMNANDIIGRGDGPHAKQLGLFRFMSRRHASVFKNGGAWVLKDLGSANKTRLNGTVLEPEKEYGIKKGDVIIFGDQEFTVQ